MICEGSLLENGVLSPIQATTDNGRHEAWPRPSTTLSPHRRHPWHGKTLNQPWKNEYFISILLNTYVPVSEESFDHLRDQETVVTVQFPRPRLRQFFDKSSRAEALPQNRGNDYKTTWNRSVLSVRAVRRLLEPSDGRQSVGEVKNCHVEARSKHHSPRNLVVTESSRHE
jgi:hypothetical protein